MVSPVGRVSSRRAARRADAPDDLQRALAAIFGNSPYLGESLLAEPDVLRRLLAEGPDQAIDGLIEDAGDTPLGSRQRCMAALRRHKRRVALAVALADIFGQWPLERVTEALTRFADLCIRQALNQALLEAAQRGDVELADQADPQASSGIAVLGMGKLGAFELNYSSDIDLIMLFAPDELRYRGREGPMAFAVRLTRALVYLLEHRSHEGYVFRVDLRLRPHPPGHPLALSVEDAAEYYERHGQNWERAALIKARVVAGQSRSASACSPGCARSCGASIWISPRSATSIRSSGRSTLIAATAGSGSPATTSRSAAAASARSSSSCRPSS